jgi:predicted Rossmann fold nucleotide-binding protein DprA/Smf involved in DNA uptake
MRWIGYQTGLDNDGRRGTGLPAVFTAALSDLAVLVSSASGSGGTWAGALEAMKRDWVPVLVRDSLDAPAGNRALLDLGAVPFPDAVIVDGVASVAGIETLLPARKRSAAEVLVGHQQQGLFED